MWSSFDKSTTHRDEACYRQQQQIGNNGSANCANKGSDYFAVFNASDPSPGSNIEDQGISFAAVEVPTRDEPSQEQNFWPFGPAGEAVASFGTSGLFSGFKGATSKNTGSSTFEIKGGPIQGLGLWNNITGGLAAVMGLFRPFSTSPVKRPPTRERRHRGLGPTSLVP